MKVAVIRFPGSNCDQDAVNAFAEYANADAYFCWHKEHDLRGADLVVLPGGFSYGDYLRPGAIARFSPIMQEVIAHAERGAPVLAICNGFQIACEAGLLPGALLQNARRQFICEQRFLRVESIATPFTTEYHLHQVVRIPIAHGDGRYTADGDTLERLEGEGRVVFRYVDAAGHASDEANPNGSMRNIAGIVNERGNVLGMMPHPERAVSELLGSSDGLPLIRSIATASTALLSEAGV